MILAIDIGNTNIVLGCIEGKRIRFIERLSTDKGKTELEYAIHLKNVLEIYDVKEGELEGGILSSVVPQITELFRKAAEKVINVPVKVVGPGLKTGLNTNEVAVGFTVLLIRLVSPKTAPSTAPAAGPRISDPSITGM